MLLSNNNNTHTLCKRTINHHWRYFFQARDPDSVSSVTYLIKEGDQDLFAIDSNTGVIRTLQPLDYEKKATYTLVVGTVENDGPDSRATATVVISVEVSCHDFL